jgi:hypothetical protein
LLVEDHHPMLLRRDRKCDYVRESTGVREGFEKRLPPRMRVDFGAIWMW